MRKDSAFLIKEDFDLTKSEQVVEMIAGPYKNFPASNVKYYAAIFEVSNLGGDSLTFEKFMKNQGREVSLDESMKLLKSQMARRDVQTLEEPFSFKC